MTQEMPNVLLVHCDEMRGMAMSCAGDPNVETPNMDRLASQGIRFSRAYTPDPVCSPARSSMMTGRLPHNTGVWKNDYHLRDDIPTLAEILQDAGYTTGHIGKWHLHGGFGSAGSQYAAVPREGQRGFDYWAGYEHGHDYWHGRYATEDGTEVHFPEGTYEPDGQTTLAMNFIEDRKDSRWHLDLGWGPPHFPMDQVKQSDLDRHPPENIQLRKNVPEDYAEQARYMLARYYAMIENLDWNSGRLLNHLDKLNLTGNTLVIFTSDHGDMMLSHGCNWKRRPYEESIHVPLLMQWPGHIRQGHCDDSLVSLVDLVPTLAGLLELPAPPTDGVSHAPRLHNQGPATEQDSVYLSCHWLGCREHDADRHQKRCWRGVRTKQYTACYVHTENDDLACVQLFDNDRDPLQMQNLAGCEEATSIRRTTDSELLKWLQETNDQLGNKPIL